jgi:hypothetical protein
MKKRGKSVPVSKRAIIQRINRKLSAEGEKLKTNRSQRWYSDLGSYYIVDENRNAVVSAHHDLEALGRELGVLAPWEIIADE